MAIIASPYGLRPVNLIGGAPYAGAIRQIKIASGYASNLYNGQVISIVATGTVELVTTVGSAASPFPAGTIGVFVGCSYTSPVTSQKLFDQKWLSGTVAADAVAYVVDDPNAVFQVQSVGSLTQADLGANVPMAAVQSTSTGSTLTGNSTSAVGATAAVTTGIAFRIVDFVNGPTSAVGDAFTDVLVKFNPSSHSYLNPVGI